MFFNFTKLMLANTMMIGVIMTICSNNWLSMWMGLEMTLLSFMPFMQTENQYSSESMIKYFIIQSVASTLFLFSIAIMLIGVNMMDNSLISVAMMMKLGSVPFHNWVLSIIESLSFYSIFTLLTILKMPPLTILYQVNTKVIMVPIMIGMLLSSISCLNQTSIRKTLAYSSIYNMSLILSAIFMYKIIWAFMLIYSLTLFLLIMIIKMFNISYINQMIINNHSNWMKILMWINMLSMSGFPPLMGFINKMIIFQTMLTESQYLLMFTMTLSSMMVTMFYMRLTFSCLLNFHCMKKWTNFDNKYLLFFISLNISLTPLIISLNEIY